MPVIRLGGPGGSFHSGPIAAATVIVVLCVAAWAANLIAVPGNWICVAMLAFYVWLGPTEGRAADRWNDVGDLVRFGTRR